MEKNWKKKPTRIISYWRKHRRKNSNKTRQCHQSKIILPEIQAQRQKIGQNQTGRPKADSDKTAQPTVQATAVSQVAEKEWLQVRDWSWSIGLRCITTKPGNATKAKSFSWDSSSKTKNRSKSKQEGPKADSDKTAQPTVQATAVSQVAEKEWLQVRDWSWSIGLRCITKYGKWQWLTWFTTADIFSHNPWEANRRWLSNQNSRIEKKQPIWHRCPGVLHLLQLLLKS